MGFASRVPCSRDHTSAQAQSQLIWTLKELFFCQQNWCISWLSPTCNKEGGCSKLSQNECAMVTYSAGHLLNIYSKIIVNKGLNSVARHMQFKLEMFFCLFLCVCFVFFLNKDRLFSQRFKRQRVFFPYKIDLKNAIYTVVLETLILLLLWYEWNNVIWKKDRMSVSSWSSWKLKNGRKHCNKQLQICHFVALHIYSLSK